MNNGTPVIKREKLVSILHAPSAEALCPLLIDAGLVQLIDENIDTHYKAVRRFREAAHALYAQTSIDLYATEPSDALADTLNVFKQLAAGIQFVYEKAPWQITHHRVHLDLDNREAAWNLGRIQSHPNDSVALMISPVLALLCLAKQKQLTERLNFLTNNSFMDGYHAFYVGVTIGNHITHATDLVASLSAEEETAMKGFYAQYMADMNVRAGSVSRPVAA